ncbi:ABC transporter ATP-binding protein/permease [Brucella pseudogrignonensis]|uniref:ABC transporter ATP-binding protein/permease n=1 Tax=Brucella pseudogrignonensis TaxID=419475 RepID=UPI0015C68723|nr:ATP-binding cassette domain-containing protein [Brucella pseudogrignonensis]
MLKQFWQLLKYCNSGEGKVLGWLLLALIFALDFIGIYLGVKLIGWTAAFYNAVEQKNAAETLAQLGVFGLIVTGNTLIYLFGYYANGWLEIRWRERLTNVALSTWFSNKAYWHLGLKGGQDSKTPDNPDQRISEDCALFVKYTLAEGVGLITRLVGLFSYVAVLAGLATFSLSFSIAGFHVEVPRYMLWAPFAYVGLSSILTHMFGRRLKATFVEQQKKEADFRFGMAHIRQNAGEIAVLNGEEAERKFLDRRFVGVRSNWFRLIGRQTLLGVFTRPYNSTILRIPMFLALPGYFTGAVNFGGLMQLGTASQQVATTLSWFIFRYHVLAELVSAITRLSNFLNAANNAGNRRELAVAGPAHSSLQLRDVALKTPEGQDLLKISDLDIEPGKTVWLRGRSGLGKTTLLRLIAGAWNFASGTLHRPDATMLVLSQKPYMPNAPLHDAVAYPLFAEKFDQAEIATALEKVGLSKLSLPAASTQQIAPGTLSGGEMQRLALARALLMKPEWLFLDEATSALDKSSETELLDLLRRELPNSTIVILAHREPGNLSIDSVIDLEAFGAAQTRKQAPVPQTA